MEERLPKINQCLIAIFWTGLAASGECQDCGKDHDKALARDVHMLAAVS